MRLEGPLFENTGTFGWAVFCFGLFCVAAAVPVWGVFLLHLRRRDCSRGHVFLIVFLLLGVTSQPLLLKGHVRLDLVRWAGVGCVVAYSFGLVVCSAMLAAKTRDAKFVLFAALSALALAVTVVACWAAAIFFWLDHNIFIPSLLITFGGLWMTANIVMNVAAEGPEDSRVHGESDGSNGNLPAPPPDKAD